MTGRAAGYCAGYAVPGLADAAPGRGFFGRGRRSGGGRGWRHWFYATGLPGWMRAGGSASAGPAPAAAAEAQALKQQAAYLAESLGEVKRRLAEMEK